MKIIGLQTMSKFDFNKLRQQVQKTGEDLKQIYKGTDAHIKAAQERFENPESRKKLSESISKKQNQKEYLDYMSNLRNQAMDKPIDNSGQTLRQKLTVANQISAANPEHYANRCAANKRMKDDPKWKAAHAQGVLAYSEETMTPMGIYPSMSKWMEEHNKPGGRSFLVSLPHLFYQIKTGPGQPTYERVYHTPFGKCATDYIAYKLAQTNKESNSIKQKNISGWWLKMAALYSEDYYITFEEARYWPIEKDIPYGMLDLETKPRIKKDKLQSTIDTWNARIINQRKLYKIK